MKTQRPQDPKDGLPIDTAVEQLRRLSLGARSSLKLVMPYEAGFAMAGARPFKPVVGFQAGFDWDHGKVFIDVGAQMRAPSAELAKEAATLGRAVDSIGEIGLILRNKALTSEQKLLAIDQRVSAFSTRDRAGTGRIE